MHSSGDWAVSIKAYTRNYELCKHITVSDEHAREHINLFFVYKLSSFFALHVRLKCLVCAMCKSHFRLNGARCSGPANGGHASRNVDVWFL